MHICTKSIQIYFGIFFDFIFVLLSFHCLHTIPIFSKIFPIFLAILFTSKACHFDMALLILLPFKHPHSRTSCGIKSYHTQHTHAHLDALSRVEAGAETGYMWVETLTHISLLSVLTVTEEVRTHCFYSFIVLINCIIVSVRYY